MSHLKIVETSTGKYSLLLNAGSTDVDDVVEDLGREPNGYFWEGVAQRLVAAEAPGLDERFGYDPEGGMFCAYGDDRDALEALAALMEPLASDKDRMRALIAAADADGFEFDD
ncbi:Imm51 family immunity protein [Glycomyces mayteni]|uniref:Imm51 family immunity protein n=1 Tax=Glycomyces mayteni TaxID=543887 RepID=A0ABW2D3L4_9ACTN|nr:hypothetical protein GCM10025732_43550 [Glycomyces mayteni]